MLFDQKAILLFIGAGFYKLWVSPGAELKISRTASGMKFSGVDEKNNSYLYDAKLMMPFSTDFNY